MEQEEPEPEPETWDDRLREMFTHEQLAELEAIEQSADERTDEAFHNPYLDAFEAIYDTRQGFAPMLGIGPEADGDAGYVTRNHGTFIRPGSNASLQEIATQHWMALRHHWVQRYAWAIPTREAVEMIAEFSPIVEIGAGTGYWAYLIEQCDGDVACIDKAPPDADAQWHPVEEGTHNVLADGGYADYALFLCWPRFDNSVSHEALEYYEGDVVIYVGEGPDGCNATPEFFGALDAGDWQQTHGLDIPIWEGLHDRLEVYER